MGDPEPNGADYGPWNSQELTGDRSGWHPHSRRLYDYWLEIAPAGLLPGRQHVSPIDIAPLLPRIWMLDVVRDPLRFRYRLLGTGGVSTLGREFTGHWLDDAHPEYRDDPLLNARYRYMVETGRPTWRRGPVRWEHDSLHREVENCMVPLAADGRKVDILFAVSVMFRADGSEVRV
jgi:hypothetical protein